MIAYADCGHGEEFKFMRFTCEKCDRIEIVDLQKELDEVKKDNVSLSHAVLVQEKEIERLKKENEELKKAVHVLSGQFGWVSYDTLTNKLKIATEEKEKNRKILNEVIIKHSNERYDLRAKLKITREAFSNIVKHQEFVGGNLVNLSSVAKIAKEAIKELDKQ